MLASVALPLLHHQAQAVHLQALRAVRHLQAHHRLVVLVLTVSTTFLPVAMVILQFVLSIGFLVQVQY